jgi:transaldolase
MKLFAAGSGLAELEAGVRVAPCEGVVLERGTAGPGGLDGVRELVTALSRLVDGPVFVGVTPDAADVQAEAQALGALGRAVVPRIPFGEAGLAAIRACAQAGVATNAVGCATPADAVVAARAGARWLSPAWDLPADGAARGALLGSLRNIIAAVESFAGKAQVLVGPAPDRTQLVDVAFAGAHAGSARLAVLQEIARRREEDLAVPGTGV